MSGKAFALIPVWLLILALKPILPKGHMFKNDISFSDFVVGATPTSVAFGVFFWWSGVNILIISLILLMEMAK